ncbi:MAG: hypothetical protein EP298_09770 [Gammaproteobacteria bacterium]|nr:MAG: hypothetical protein EP298_09770 [Gammaproteobacteria bacterium]UTW42237.1 hypothetical protein KFE69_12215 [bacterium SCSIO 12844]
MNKLLDKEEKKIKESLKKDEYISLKGAALEKRKAELQSKAKATMSKTRKPISFKPDPDILSAFKEKAQAEGFPYQTLLNLLMKHYVEGNFSVQIRQSKK